jgi:nicotinate-nucleotide adenylyltransferase
MPRFGLFGGSFDPAHRGHAALARAAVREIPLDRLYVMPARRSPHKTRPLSGSRHRLKALQSLFHRDRRVRVSPWELRRPGPSYTIDTLTAFQRRFPRMEWHVVMGGDSFSRFKSWRRWREILRRAGVAVASRPGAPRVRIPRAWKDRVLLLSSPMPKASSTALRKSP